ncbi:unnamed protein product [Nezara viridula]|uniref:Uncharacterized protein n=1 Tax=Nezara viridula TaxID=85310 RepID=A0A9P0HHR6_NEZVI|nr:unnamed protein product [Nezara viridula]
MPVFGALVFRVFASQCYRFHRQAGRLQALTCSHPDPRLGGTARGAKVSFILNLPHPAPPPPSPLRP